MLSTYRGLRIPCPTSPAECGGMGTEQLGMRTAGEAWLPDDGAVVCCITGDAALREYCARVAAAAGLGFAAVASAEEAGPLWADAALVLLGTDVADLPPQRRHDVILVGRGEDRALLWERAVSLGAEHVAELPEAAGWLVEFFGRSQGGAVQGSVLGLIGGCGGAGASTTAALLAGASSLAGRRTLLVDGDRLAGGLELSVSPHRPEGLHWRQAGRSILTSSRRLSLGSEISLCCPGQLAGGLGRGCQGPASSGSSTPRGQPLTSS